MFASGKSASVSAVANYIEDVFSTWLYTGNGSTQTITNNIDLSTKGGLVWIKDRDSGAKGHALFDTARGVNLKLQSQSTNGQFSGANQLTAFNTTGFDLGSAGDPNGSGTTYASWTFRKQPKFFDVVTYTGTGANRTISHNLGSVPGCIIVKRTDTTADWAVYHRSLANTQYLVLNTTAAAATGATWWNSTTPTSSVFSLGTDASVNASGGTYVAYLFAHDAGGFGLTGADNVISCGSFTTDASAYANVNLGYEPQWVLQKQTDSTNSWYLTDNMRGSTTLGGQMAQLLANVSNVESTGTGGAHPTATGFESTGLAISGTFIYIAIRRGPMKVPTTGTSVFSPVSTSGNVTSITSGFPVDFALGKEIKNSTSYGNYAIDRLRGGAVLSETNTTGAEYTSQTFKFDSNTQFLQSGGGLFYGPSIYWLMRRAPGFFDEVCYSGAGTQALTHNLGVVPEMFILKNRAGGTDGNWIVYHAAVGNTAALQLNLTATPAASNVYFNSTSPTSTVFTIGTNQSSSGGTYVAYLFATCPGVSKVGNYTGNGSNQTINCGFTGGARFVMIKRTDSTGDWYVWDTARGIVSGNDPRLSLNTTAAEVTTDDSVDTDSTGFVVNQLSATNINVTSATYIFLSIS